MMEMGYLPYSTVTLATSLKPPPELHPKIKTVLNGTSKRPECPTGHGVHRPGRCAIKIFYHIGQGPVHPKCILTYRPAGTPYKFSIILVRVRYNKNAFYHIGRAGEYFGRPEHQILGL